MKTIKRWLENIILGVIASAIFAYLVAPDQQIQLGALALGLVTIPLIAIFISAFVALSGIYLVIRIIEILAVKLHILDLLDGGN